MSRWFRFYDDAINDPKVVGLSDECYRGWVGLLCVASKHKGVLPPVSDLSFYLRMKPQRVATLIARLVSAKLLDRVGDTYEPHNWGGRQYVSDSTERVKRHRQKRAAAGLVAQWQPSKELRNQVYARDGFECVYCHSDEDLTIDHKVPELRGGTHDDSNLQTACRKCNASKRDLTHDEFVARNGHVTVTDAFQERPQSTEQNTDDRIGPRASAFTPGSKALTHSLWRALGIESPLHIPPELAGADWRAIEWERAGWTGDLIEAECRRIGPGKPLVYYEKVFATAFAKRSAPLPNVEVRQAETLTVTHGKPKNGITQAADDLCRQLADFDGPPRRDHELRGPEGETSPRLLSHG